MNWLGAALRELFSLFVDDVWFTPLPNSTLPSLQAGKRT